MKYRDFNSSLTPDLSSDDFIGVRTPILRSYAKTLYKENKELAFEFINTLPHKYFEENQLHAFIISEIRDYEESIREVNRFLPYVNNWATCDQLKPKPFSKNKDNIFKIYKGNINSKNLWADFYYAYYKFIADGNHTGDVAWSPIWCYIYKVAATKTNPSNNAPNYTGSAVQIINAGSSSHGTFYYNTSPSDTGATTDASAAALKVTAAGSYNRYWKFVPDSNHSGNVEWTLITCTIGKAASSITNPGNKSIVYATSTNTYSITCSGCSLSDVATSNSAAVQVGRTGNSITLYAIGNASSTATITLYGTGDSSHNDPSPVSFTVTVTKAATATATTENKTYSGSSQTGVSGNWVSWTGTTSATNAGTYTAYATPDSNHTWSDGTTTKKTITWTMYKADQTGTPTVTGSTSTYPTSATATATGTGQGSIEWENGVNSRSTAGTTSVRARFAGNNNYNPGPWSTSKNVVVNKGTPVFTLTNNNQTYNGNYVYPSTSVNVSGRLYYNVNGIYPTLNNYTSSQFSIYYSANNVITNQFASGNAGTTKWQGIFIPTDTNNWNYITNLEISFTVVAQTISSSNVTFSNLSHTYDGTAKTATITVKNSAGTTLTSGTDYTITNGSRTNAGSQYPAITGTGNYTGTVTSGTALSIAKSNAASISISVSPSSMDMSGGAGQEVTVAVTSNAGSSLPSSGLSDPNNVLTNFTSKYSSGNSNYYGGVTTGNPGTVTFTASTASSNYNVKTASATFVMNKMTPSVTIKNGSTTINRSVSMQANASVTLTVNCRGCKVSGTSDGKYVKVTNLNNPNSSDGMNSTATITFTGQNYVTSESINIYFTNLNSSIYNDCDTISISFTLTKINTSPQIVSSTSDTGIITSLTATCDPTEQTPYGTTGAIYIKAGVGLSVSSVTSNSTSIYVGTVTNIPTGHTVYPIYATSSGTATFTIKFAVTNSNLYNLSNSTGQYTVAVTVNKGTSYIRDIVGENLTYGQQKTIDLYKTVARYAESNYTKDLFRTNISNVTTQNSNIVTVDSYHNYSTVSDIILTPQGVGTTTITIYATPTDTNRFNAPSPSSRAVQIEVYPAQSSFSLSSTNVVIQNAYYSSAVNYSANCVGSYIASASSGNSAVATVTASGQNFSITPTGTGTTTITINATNETNYAALSTTRYTMSLTINNIWYSTNGSTTTTLPTGNYDNLCGTTWSSGTTKTVNIALNASASIKPDNRTCAWIKFVAPKTDQITINTDINVGSETDTYGYVLDSTGTQITSNDDGSSRSSDNLDPQLTWSATKDSVYYILLAPYVRGTTSGNVVGTLTMS